MMEQLKNMKCTLMNKNEEVLVAEYNEALKVFTDIYEIKNIEYSGIHNLPKIKIRCHSDSRLQKTLKDCGINAYPINSELTVFLNSNLENPDILKGGF